MTSLITLRIFTNGGIVTPEELRKITQIASLCGCEAIMPGSRQELYLKVEKSLLITAEVELSKHGINYTQVENRAENIVCSFAALQILPTTAWLLEDTYLDILDSFTYQPKLKINIVDPLQNLVPLFTGQLNFIASSYPRYWHLYIDFPSISKRQVWPVLIDGDDIGNLSKLIEEVYDKQYPATVQDLYAAISEIFTGRTRHREEEIHLPVVQPFPLIEGIHAYGNACWLGIYRRNQCFPLGFLDALYKQCIEYKVGNICLTPHKTLLIKDIRKEDMRQWKKMLGIHRINIQHSALELNWQLPDLDAEAMQLKTTWVSELEEREIYTADLSFAVQTHPIDIAASVIIKQNYATSKDSKKYDVLYANDFTSHSLQWQVFASNISVKEVAATIMDLCQVYYSKVGLSSPQMISEEVPVLVPSHNVYQCPDCLTIYNPEYGDATATIPPGTSFQELPDTYTCSLCEAPITSFVVVETVSYTNIE